MHLFGAAAESAFWREAYTPSDVYGLVCQYRQSLALVWVDELGLEPGAAALELVRGDGLARVELAKRGLRVTDCAPGNARHLPFDAGSFELAIAMDVIPRLDTMRELARVLKPRGALIASCDNSRRLNRKRSIARFDRLLTRAGFGRQEGHSFGFGRRRWARSGAGIQYVVLARSCDRRVSADRAIA
jgi:SAM-dependent methyltransferase